MTSPANSSGPESRGAEGEGRRGWVHPSVAKGATRMALRELLDNQREDERRRCTLPRNKKLHPNSLAGRKNLAVHMSNTRNRVGKPLMSKCTWAARWIELTASIDEFDGWNGISIDMFELDLKNDGHVDMLEICFLDMHLLQRMAQRDRRLDVMDFGRAICPTIAPIIYAARLAGATRFAVPHGNGGVLLGYRDRAHNDMIRMATYISHDDLSSSRRAQVAQLREDLPEMPKLPRYTPYDPVLCTQARQAMERANPE